MKPIPEILKEFDEKFGTYDLNATATLNGKKYKAKDFVLDFLQSTLQSQLEEVEKNYIPRKKVEEEIATIEREAKEARELSSGVAECIIVGAMKHIVGELRHALLNDKKEE